MSRRLLSKVAVITGGASGIGAATTRRFLAEGASVVVGDLNARSCADVLTSVSGTELAPRLRVLRTDVRAEADIENLFSLAVEEFQTVDVVFNNAGIGGAFGRLDETSADDWDQTFAVLVRGVFLGMKHAVRIFRSHGRPGSIVNTASVAGLGGGVGPIAYSSAKAAVINLGRAAAAELAEHRVRVNTICPGPIVTPLFLGRRSEEEARARMAPFVPLPYLGEPEDVAAAAVFLASEESKFVTGETMLVDGGMIASGPSASRWGGLEQVPESVTGMNNGTSGLSSVIRRHRA